MSSSPLKRSIKAESLLTINSKWISIDKCISSPAKESQVCNYPNFLLNGEQAFILAFNDNQCLCNSSYRYSTSICVAWENILFHQPNKKQKGDVETHVNISLRNVEICLTLFSTEKIL